MMLKLIALTMMCDSNRVILMQWPGFVTFKWDGMDHQYDHHGLSHRNGSAAVGCTRVEGVIDKPHQSDTWYAARVAKPLIPIHGTHYGHCASGAAPPAAMS